MNLTEIILIVAAILNLLIVILLFIKVKEADKRTESKINWVIQQMDCAGGQKVIEDLENK